jgi:hypothetical protein
MTHLSDLHIPILLQVFTFLEIKDIKNVSLTSSSLYKTSMDEYLWRKITRREFIDIPSSFIPNDNLWRAEYKFRKEEKRRFAEYQRAIILGMVGLWKNNRSRLSGKRYSYFGNNPHHTNKIMENTNQNCITTSYIDSVSNNLGVPARQGNCSWTVLRAANPKPREEYNTLQN